MPAKQPKTAAVIYWPDRGAVVVLKRPLTNACGHTFQKGAAMTVHDYEMSRLILTPAAQVDRKVDRNFLAAPPEDVEEVCA